MEDTHRYFHDLTDEVGKIIVGQRTLINRLIIALLSRGHILIEGLPGLAKTLCVNCLATTLSAEFTRIQFTPDLLPADLIGTTIYNPKEGSFHVMRGPIFTNVLLADEINRAPAKVQSALLEVMQEKQVTIGTTSYPVEEPFIVLATQNPIEHEGTYPLPEAQTDRFLMKVKMDYPSLEEEKEVIARTNLEPQSLKPILNRKQIEEATKQVSKVFVDEKIISYILRIVFATRNPDQYGVDATHLILYGASPRASIGFTKAAKAHAFLHGRDYVTPDDVRQLAPDILRHRIRRTYEAEAEGISPEYLVEKILAKVPLP